MIAERWHRTRVPNGSPSRDNWPAPWPSAKRRNPSKNRHRAELIVIGALLHDFVVLSYLHANDLSVAKLHLNIHLASISTVLFTSGWLAAEA